MLVQDAYKLQDYFTILDVLKIFDDVLIFRLQEESSSIVSKKKNPLK